MKFNYRLLLLALITMIPSCKVSNVNSSNNNSSVNYSSADSISNQSTNSTSIDYCFGESILLEEINWEGIENLELAIGDYFNVESKIKITHKYQNDLKQYNTKPYLSVSTNYGTINEYGDFNSSNLSIGQVVKLTYKIDISYLISECVIPNNNLIVEQHRYLTIIEPTINLVLNGDFEAQTDGWDATADDTKLGIIKDDDNNYLYIDVDQFNLETSIFTDPNDENAAINFENGHQYQVTFSAKSDRYRPIALEVGAFLNELPVPFMCYTAQEFNLTEDWKSYQLIFSMEETTTNKGHIIFNVSNVNNVWVEGRVYFDDIAIRKISVDTINTTAPVLEGINFGYAYIRFTDEYDVLHNVKAYDAYNQDITDDIYYRIYRDSGESVRRILRSDVDIYYVLYFIEDEYGNLTIKKRRIDIIADSFPVPNFFGTPLGLESGSLYDALTEKRGNFVYEIDTNEIIIDSLTTYHEEVLTITYETTVTSEASLQLYYAPLLDFGDNEYNLTFNLMSQVETTIIINEEEISLQIGSNEISVSMMSMSSFRVYFKDNNKICPSGTYIFSKFGIDN